MNHAILRNAAMLRTPPHQLLRSLRRQAPAASASASASTFRPAAVVIVPSFPVRHFSITYSGGQASEGQGGFYGSGGSRKNTNVIEHHPEALGDMEDIQTLMKVMEGVEKLEEKLAESMAAHGSSINEESIELKVGSCMYSCMRGFVGVASIVGLLA